ncbi:MAG: dicarboxylate/amino acid:cation symporter [Crocinitomicaceae bacterium]|nr:dicarboxylate/amino acid:cation symporter [Crocinitomicaceae bacterium]
MIIVRPINELRIHLNRLTKGKLWLRVIIAIILGIILGLFLNPRNGYVSIENSETWSDWLNLPGSVFLRMVQMIMIPLIFTSILTGIVSNNSSQLKVMGVRLALYFLITTSVAIIIGIVLSIAMAPGAYISDLGGFSGGSDELVVSSSRSIQSFPDAISGLIPTNPLESMMTGEMLGIVIFTIIIGVAVTQIKEELARPLVRLSEAIQKICMIVVSWAMLLVPYAVFGMMAALMATLGTQVLYGLGYYMLVVILGLVLLLVFYMIVVSLVAKRNPIEFLKAIREPQLLAFSTASSAAVMPLSMEAADKKLGVSSNISDFIIPIGATINMDGTALFQCVTTIFMAQAYGIELSLISMVLITITIVGASIGTPAIPGGGVVILASVLSSTGIPTDGLIVIIGIDRILGMFRTTLNVTGDLTACVIFDRWFGDGNKAKALP